MRKELVFCLCASIACSAVDAAQDTRPKADVPTAAITREAPETAGSVEGKYVRAEELFRAQRYDEARALFEQVRAKAGNFKETAKYLGEINRLKASSLSGSARGGQAQPASPSGGLSAGETVSRLLVDGRRSFKDGDYDSARQQFAEALKLDSSNAEARKYLGEIERERGTANFDPTMTVLDVPARSAKAAKSAVADAGKAPVQVRDAEKPVDSVAETVRKIVTRDVTKTAAESKTASSEIAFEARTGSVVGKAVERFSSPVVASVKPGETPNIYGGVAPAPDLKSKAKDLSVPEKPVVAPDVKPQSEAKPAPAAKQESGTVETAEKSANETKVDSKDAKPAGEAEKTAATESKAKSADAKPAEKAESKAKSADAKPALKKETSPTATEAVKPGKADSKESSPGKEAPSASGNPKKPETVAKAPEAKAFDLLPGLEDAEAVIRKTEEVAALPKLDAAANLKAKPVIEEKAAGKDAAKPVLESGKPDIPESKVTSPASAKPGMDEKKVVAASAPAALPKSAVKEPEQKPESATLKPVEKKAPSVQELAQTTLKPLIEEKKAESADPRVEADKFVRQAQRELAKSDKGEALKSAKKASELDPNNVEAKALIDELEGRKAVVAAPAKSAAEATKLAKAAEPPVEAKSPPPAKGEVPVAKARKASPESASKASQAEAAFQKGLAAYEDGKLDVAVQWWNYALTLVPEHARAVQYLHQTRPEYDAWVQQHQYNGVQLQKEANATAKLDMPITYDTAGQKSIVEFLSALSLITDISFYVADGVDPEVRLTAKFEDVPLTEALDTAFLPIGLKWSRSGDVVSVTPDLKTKFFNLSPDQVARLKTLLENKTLQKILYGPDGMPPMRNVELLLDDRENVLLVTDSQENISKVEAFLKDMQQSGPPALVYKSWKIRPEEGQKIKALVEAIVRVQSDAPYDLERKIVVDGSDLIVKDTADNVRKIEELLLDKNFIKKLETQKLNVATFNLTPRDQIVDNLEQVRDMARNIVTVVKTILYSQSTESAAAAEGRRYWYDPNTLQLTVTDFPENLRAVSEYIRSLPLLGKKQKSEIIFLKHQTASELADVLDRVLGLSTQDRGSQASSGNSVTKSLRVEGELTFRDLRIRVTRINDNDIADKNDDSVEMVIRTGTTSEDRTIEEFRSEFIDDYELNVIEVKPSGTPGEGSAKLEVRYSPQTTGSPQIGPTTLGPNGQPLQVDQYGRPIQTQQQTAPENGMQVETIENMNALLIRYDDPGDFAEVKSYIDQLDIPVLQVSIETKLVEVNETRAKEFQPEFNVLNLGKQGIDFPNSMLDMRFANEFDEFRSPYDPFPEGPNNASLMRGTTVLSFIAPGETPIAFTLRMLEAEGVVNMVNGPMVTVENGETADFEIERRFGSLPSVQVGGTGTQTASGSIQSLQQVSMSVTPQITQLGEIRLEISDLELQDFGNESGFNGLVTIDVDQNDNADPYEPRAIAASSANTFDVRRRSLQTVARVNDGGTIVLGGWTGERSYQGDSGIPMLRKIPYIGKLFFNRTADHMDKTTLLVFLTCHLQKP
jgi:type II secretory pathway component GspD/PulD (secretin)